MKSNKIFLGSEGSAQVKKVVLDIDHLRSSPNSYLLTL